MERFSPNIYLFIGCFFLVVAIAAIWGRISLRKQLMHLAKTRESKLPIQPRTSISIERDGGQLWMRRFNIYIDGRKVGEVLPEEIKFFEVSPGVHSVQVRLDWFRSSIVTATVTNGQSFRLQCGIRRAFYEFNSLDLFYLIFRPQSVLYLEKLPSSKERFANRESVVPLTIGFANLGGDDLLPLLTEDVAALSSMFKNTNIAPATRLPSCEILFLYAHLRVDGTLAGIDVQAGLRQIAQLTGAMLIVLASPCSSDAAQKCVALPGQKLANLILTLDRREDGFAKFFRELFELMGTGTPLLNAWVELAPQHPSAMPDFAPETLLIAEAGNIKFPALERNLATNKDALR